MCPQRSVARLCITNRIYPDCSRNEPNSHMINARNPPRDPAPRMIELVQRSNPSAFAEANMDSPPMTKTRACRRLLPNVDACRLPSYASSDAIIAAMSEAIAGLGGSPPFTQLTPSPSKASDRSFLKLGTPSKNKDNVRNG